jgi:hypothetical protein
VQSVALLVLITLAVSHWLLEPMTLLFKPFFLLSWMPWAFLGVGLWLLAGDAPPHQVAERGLEVGEKRNQ